MLQNNFQLISKSIFFQSSGILAIGDLHLGYENMLKQQGIEFPFNQLEQTKKDLLEIIHKIPKNKLKKIVLLGDIKHHFSFDKGEMFEVRNFLKFLEQFVKKENIILIKGNHDKILLKEYKYYDYFIEREIAFTHGDNSFPAIFDKKVKTIVIGHLHPATTLSDKHTTKREKYKCFLIGKYKHRELIVVPSFFPLVEGSKFNLHENTKHFFVDKKLLKKFNVFVVGEQKVYPFGKLKK